MLATTLRALRQQSSAWQLLASRRAPLVLACLLPMFEQRHDAVKLENAEAQLSDMFTDFANDDTFALTGDQFHILARRELRTWIKKGLLIEREGELLATDALQRVFLFVKGLTEQRMMTSTASRLATVQRSIDELAVSLNPDPDARRHHIVQRIEALEAELADIDAGKVHTLSSRDAVEQIQEVYTLAMGLRDDFRRVEDTFREADRALRQKVIQAQAHRGEIVDQLLDTHDELLQTPEGKVFHHFHLQLQNAVQLEQTKAQIRDIIDSEHTPFALSAEQQTELRWLVMQLTKEAANVSKARGRSERDVKNYLQTGLAQEHHRVGQLVNDLLAAALDIDWTQASVRKTPTALPVVGVKLGNSPLIERFRYKPITDSDAHELQLEEVHDETNELDDAFWQALATLDRKQLYDETLMLLETAEKGLSLSQLAERYPTSLASHDLEIFSLWLNMARDADLPISETREHVDILDDQDQITRFDLPHVVLDYKSIAQLAWE